MKQITLLFSVLVALSGCASNPTYAPPEQLQGADYGIYPKEYQEEIKASYTKSLFDPYSAQYRFPAPPIKAYLREAPIQGGDVTAFGYAAQACVNAKNRMGGYVGEKCRWFFFRQGVLQGPIIPNIFFAEPWFK